MKLSIDNFPCENSVDGETPLPLWRRVVASSPLFELFVMVLILSAIGIVFSASESVYRGIMMFWFFSFSILFVLLVLMHWRSPYYPNN